MNKIEEIEEIYVIFRQFFPNLIVRQILSYFSNSCRNKKCFSDFKIFTKQKFIITNSFYNNLNVSDLLIIGEDYSTERISKDELLNRYSIYTIERSYVFLAFLDLQNGYEVSLRNFEHFKEYDFFNIYTLNNERFFILMVGKKRKNFSLIYLEMGLKKMKKKRKNCN